MTINNFCKTINEFGYNICISLETYLENYRIYNKKMLIKQDLETLKMYIIICTKNTLNYLTDYFKMYDSFLFNYTMKNIHDFILKNILDRN